jgi:tRNA A-37 threonylcarbamoyl transferase component Bud32
MHAVMGAGRLIGGRYRLQEPIGRGAMGIVWRGRDELLARDVAVKEVQVTTQASPAEAEVIYQRTLREARTAGRLSHPGVVKVFDVVEEAGSPWIIMELVEARSLDRVITEEGPLPPDRAAELGTSLVGALAAAHGAGVLHRDVKPSNVLVTDEGRAVLTDFGIATFAEDLALTQAGMVVGTPGFTAPERIRGEIATPAADLWSLGATLYAAVEGRGPFDRVGGSSAISTGVANEDAPRAPSAGPLGPVIDALLSRDPGTRPDAATAERMLTEAATAARTGPRPLQDGWLAAEAGREPAISLDAPTDGVLPIVADSGFLDPPDYEVLKIPAQQPEPARADSGERPMADAVLAGAGLAGVGLAGAEFADGAQATPAPASVLDPSSGPVLWGPVKSSAGQAGAAPGGPGEGPGGSGGSGGQGGGSGGQGGATAPAQPWWRSSGRWRLMLAAGGIAALIVAAIVTWNIFQHSGPASALGSTAPPGTVARASGHGNSGSGPASSTKPGGHHASSGPSAGGTSGTHNGSPTTSKSGHPRTAPSGHPSGTPTTSGGSPGSPSGSPSPSPTTSPTPTPTPSSSSPSTGVTLPAGYRWHKFPAAQLGALAGFKIGMPVLWTQGVSAPVAHLNQVARSFHLAVDLSYWLYTRPLREAQYLQNQAAAAHKGHKYKELLLTTTNFTSLGGFRSATAGELKYSWNNASLGYNETELVVLVTLNTSAGPQSYEFELWAPTQTFGSARSILTTALPTFRPLPG